ncbi:MAG TPA: phosphoribosyltransferase family protein [Vicinamibacterales bacterium]|nr:phosphoribosyltransferase family protein [Vicinamibacterales bacterium]
MAFENRAEAARMLAGLLAVYRGQRPVVLAIPRGAVPMGKILADALGGDLDVVLVRKLRAPFNPELAIGSIDESGALYLDPDTRDLWDEPYLEAETRAQLATLHARRHQYEPAGAPIDVAGRIVIVLDDGIATGSTMIAALRAIRAKKPAKLIAATGVAAADTVRRIAAEADEVVCAETPMALIAIGYHYRDFAQVSDEEVVATLRAAKPAASAIASRHTAADGAVSHGPESMEPAHQHAGKQVGT